MKQTTDKDMPTLSLKDVPYDERVQVLNEYRASLDESVESFRVDYGSTTWVLPRVPVVPALYKYTVPYDKSTPAPDNAKLVVTDPHNVRQTFLELTKYTVPHGFEGQFYDDLLAGLGFVKNERGNYWLHIENDGKTSETLFVAHLDTADSGKPKLVTHVLQDNIVGTDGTCLLGADDRAGVAILLYLAAKQVPGSYLMVVGEERGCVGSRNEAKVMRKNIYRRAIQFDRGSKSEIITHQVGSRTASREFARALAKQLRKASNHKISLGPSDRGFWTDTNVLRCVITECTNISAGYTGAHSTQETQDLDYLENLAHAAANVDWESLPSKRPLSKPHDDNTPGRKLTRRFFEKDDSPWDDEISMASIWELWGNIDSGSWSDEDVITWVKGNPAMAAAILIDYVATYPQESLGSLTTIEEGGVV